MSDLVERLRTFVETYPAAIEPSLPATVRGLLDRIEALESLISEESIERLAKDIAEAIVEPRKEILELRHSAMVRLGKRLREPFPRDLEFVATLNRSHGADNG